MLQAETRTAAAEQPTLSDRARAGDPDLEATKIRAVDCTTYR
jgi:hypothetical protein